MTTMRRLDAERVFLALAGVQALANATMFTTGMVYYIEAAGMNPLQLVLVGTALEATYFLFEVPTGVLADVHGRRRSVIAGILCLGASFVWVGALPAFVSVMLAQVLSGIGYTFTSGATEAWLAGEVGEDRFGRVMLRAGQLERALGLLGIALSVALASRGLHLPFLAGGTMFLALGVFLLVAMQEHAFKPQPPPPGEAAPWHAMRATFVAGAGAMRGQPLLVALFVVEIFSGAASEGIDRLSAAHLLENFVFPAVGGFTPVVWFGLLGAVGSVFSMLVVWLFGRSVEGAAERPGGASQMLLALNALGVIAVVAFALAGRFEWAMAALLIRSAVRALAYPLYSAWLVRHIDPAVRATVISMIGQGNALGQIGGGPALGALGTFVSLRAALAAAGGLLAPTLLVFARLARTEVRRPAAEEVHP